jgi:hypothetical protein
VRLPFIYNLIFENASKTFTEKEGLEVENFKIQTD